MAEMKALITGANGFVGSWLTHTLVQDGWDITALIKDKRQSPVFDSISKRFKIARGDVTDFSSLAQLFKDIDICFHLAAQPIVGLASSSPLGTLDTNIRGTYNILEAARLSNTKVIVASSDKSYGSQEKLPYVEDAPLLAWYPYDVSKACCDMLSFSYFKTYRLPVTVMRFCNIFGGGDINFSRIIPGTIRSIIENKDPVIRSDGSPIRQYAYIKDIIGGYKLLAAGMQNKRILGEAFNFGSYKPISVLDLTKLLIKLSGNTTLKPITLSNTKHEIDKQYASSKKAEKLLGWKTEYKFEDALKETIEWYRNFFRV